MEKRKHCLLTTGPLPSSQSGKQTNTQSAVCLSICDMMHALTITITTNLVKQGPTLGDKVATRDFQVKRMATVADTGIQQLQHTGHVNNSDNRRDDLIKNYLAGTQANGYDRTSLMVLCEAIYLGPWIVNLIQTVLYSSTLSFKAYIMQSFKAYIIPKPMWLSLISFNNRTRALWNWHQFPSWFMVPLHMPQYADYYSLLT